MVLLLPCTYPTNKPSVKPKLNSTYSNSSNTSWCFFFFISWIPVTLLIRISWFITHFLMKRALESNSDNLGTCALLSIEIISTCPYLLYVLLVYNSCHSITVMVDVSFCHATLEAPRSTQLVLASYPRHTWNHIWHIVVSQCMFEVWMSAMKTLSKDHL